MRSAWYIRPATAEWVKAASKIGGMSASEFVERLIRYHASDLHEGELQTFETLLNVAENAVSIDSDWSDEE